MAYIGQVSIRDSGHMGHAIDYISREDKALSLDEFKTALQERLMHLQSTDTSSGERSTCINCSATNTFKDFENMRRAYGQDKGVIAHHYFQSFQKDDDITPELAHQIGVELAKKMFPDFQVVVATHIDREHVHNHIIVNSCNISTGRKWYSNKQSLADIRRESDKLCLKHGLGIIDKQSKYKGIDRTTYQCGLQGTSWKIQLVSDLEQAIECCHSKEEFITFLEKRDYTVRYRDMHITIKKNGEKKGIRVDTLAKQFGEKFTKENLEKQMGYYTPPPSEILEQYASKPKTSPKPSAQKSNWEHYEQYLFKQLGCLPSSPGRICRHEKAEEILQSTAPIKKATFHKLVLRFLLFMAALTSRRQKGLEKKKYQRTDTIPQLRPARQYLHLGNISYKKLTECAGENFRIRVNLERLLQLTGQPILYAASIDRKTGTATLTIKAKDKDFLAELLNLVEVKGRLIAQSEKLSNQLMYQKLKETAETTQVKLSYMVVTPEQVQSLKEHYIDFAYFDKGDGKCNIAFLPDHLELIKSIVYPKPKQQSEQQKNAHIYAELKKSAAQAGEKLMNRTKLTGEQLDKVRKMGITFAYFKNKEDETLYNIAFERKDAEAIYTVLETEQQRNTRIYAQLKKAAVESGERLQYRVKLSGDQIQALRKLDIAFAYFQNQDDTSLFNIAFEKKDFETIQAALTSREKKQTLG